MKRIVLSCAGLLCCLSIGTSINGMHKSKTTRNLSKLQTIKENETLTPQVNEQASTTPSTPGSSAPDKKPAQQTSLQQFVFIGVKTELPHGIIVQALYESVDRENKKLAPLSPFMLEKRVPRDALQRIEFNRLEQRGQGEGKNYFKIQKIQFLNQKTKEMLKEMFAPELENGTYFFAEFAAPEGTSKPPRSPDSPSAWSRGKHVQKQKRYSKSMPSSLSTSPENIAITKSEGATPTPVFIMPPHSPSGKSPIERPAHDASSSAQQTSRDTIRDLSALPEPPPGDAQ